MRVETGSSLGAYTMEERLGRGGMATVYRAHRADLDRDVAVKVLPEFFSEEPGFRDRFQQEAVAVAKLRHPNIPVVFDYGEDSGRAYMVSEYVDGGTLDTELTRPIPVHRVVALLAPVASALDYAHTQGVIHRDVKPSNVLMRKDGTPLLSDFGLAKIAGAASLTTAGSILGTPEYMSPEQCSGEDLTPATDLYSLGVIAYQMLTGQKPFTAQTPAAVLVAQLSAPLPLPRKLNPKIPSGVEVALLKALAKAPEDRYPSCTAFIAALAAGATEPEREAFPRWLLALVAIGIFFSAIQTANGGLVVVQDLMFSCSNCSAFAVADLLSAIPGFVLLVVAIVAAIDLRRGRPAWRPLSMWGLGVSGIVFGFVQIVYAMAYLSASRDPQYLLDAQLQIVQGIVLAVPYAAFLFGLSRRAEWAWLLGWPVSAVGLLTGAPGLAFLSLWALRRPFTPRLGR